MAILLCTYNGARFLQEQLNSYLTQTDTAWDLWVSDDGSTDETRDIILAFQQKVADKHKVHLLAGPRKGAAANYLFLMTHPDIPTGLTALSDQDDIWQPDRLARARAALSGQNGATLYGAQSLYCGANGHITGASSVPKRPPSFENALVQNIVSGHTAAFNADALHLIQKAGPPAQPIPFHDWWIYQLITGAGGHVIIDPKTTVIYRQHDSNAIGAATRLNTKILRLWQLLNGTFYDWMSLNLTALKAVSVLLEPSAVTRITLLLAHPRRIGLRRLSAFTGLIRQSRAHTALLLVAVFLGRL